MLVAFDISSAQNFDPFKKQKRFDISSAKPVDTGQPNIDTSKIPEFATVGGNEALFGSQFGDEGVGFGPILRDAAAALVTFNPKARIDGIRKRFPELEVKEFGEDNAIIRNPKNGGVAVLNSDGLSMADISPFLSAAIPGGFGANAVMKAGSLGAKALVGAGAGAATDAAFQAAEKIQGSDQEVDLGRVATSAVIGGALAPVPALAGRVAENRQVKKLVDKAAPSFEALRERAGKLYAKVDEAGVTLRPRFVESLNQRIAKVADDIGFDEGIHPKVASALKRFQGEAGQLRFGDLEKARRVMGSAAKSIEPDERRIASQLIDTIDDAIENLKPGHAATGDVSKISKQLTEARELWSRAKKSEVIQEVMEKANNQASGFENGLRTQLRSVLNNKRKLRGFNKEEIAAMKQVVNGTKTSNFMKFFGKFGMFDAQNPRALMPLLGTFAGGTVGGGVGAVLVPVVGQVSRSLAKRLTANNARFADAVVRAGKNGQQIIRSYIKTVPKAEQSAEELAELLLTRRVSAEQMAKANFDNQNIKELVSNAVILMGSQGHN